MGQNCIKKLKKVTFEFSTIFLAPLALVSNPHLSLVPTTQASVEDAKVYTLTHINTNIFKKNTHTNT